MNSLDFRVVPNIIMILCLAVICICLIFKPIETKDIFLEKDPTFDDLIIDTNVCNTEKYQVPSIITCSIFCLQNPLCKSIFYNQRTEICRIHGEKYTIQDLYRSSTSPESMYFSVNDGIKTGVRTCQELKVCNAQYGDGEYWLYPIGNNYKKTKIYCHSMTGDEPKEYITLLNKDDNESLLNGSTLSSTIPCTWTLHQIKRGLFRKIRINATNMIVDTKDVTFADLQISLHQLNIERAVEYALGIGCSIASTTKGCPRIGYFKINTTGTGLVVSPSVNFTSSGIAPVPMELYRSPDNRVIWAKCDGYCGSCHPDGPLILVNAQEHVDPESAVYPACLLKEIVRHST